MIEAKHKSNWLDAGIQADKDVKPKGSEAEQDNYKPKAKKARRLRKNDHGRLADQNAAYKNQASSSASTKGPASTSADDVCFVEDEKMYQDEPSGISFGSRKRPRNEKENDDDVIVTDSD